MQRTDQWPSSQKTSWHENYISALGVPRLRSLGDRYQSCLCPWLWSYCCSRAAGLLFQPCQQAVWVRWRIAWCTLAGHCAVLQARAMLKWVLASTACLMYFLPVPWLLVSLEAGHCCAKLQAISLVIWKVFNILSHLKYYPFPAKTVTIKDFC